MLSVKTLKERRVSRRDEFADTMSPDTITNMDIQIEDNDRRRCCHVAEPIDLRPTTSILPSASETRTLLIKLVRDYLR